MAKARMRAGEYDIVNCAVKNPHWPVDGSKLEQDKIQGYLWWMENAVYISSDKELSPGELAERAYQTWYDSEGHREAMLKDMKNNFGIAFFQQKGSGGGYVYRAVLEADGLNPGEHKTVPYTNFHNQKATLTIKNAQLYAVSKHRKTLTLNNPVSMRPGDSSATKKFKTKRGADFFGTCWLYYGFGSFDNACVEWVSSAPKVVSVDPNTGTVRAKSQGKARISAYLKNKATGHADRNHLVYYTDVVVSSDSASNDNIIYDGDICAPSTISVKKTSAFNKVKVSWDDCGYDPSGFQIYTGLEKSKCSLAAVVKGHSKRSAVVSVPTGKTVYFKVRSIYQNGDASAWSPYGKLKCSMPGLKLRSVKAGKRSIKVSWKPIKGVKGYRIKVFQRNKKGKKIHTITKFCKKSARKATVKISGKGKWYLKACGYVTYGKRKFFGKQTGRIIKR